MSTETMGTDTQETAPVEVDLSSRLQQAAFEPEIVQTKQTTEQQPAANTTTTTTENKPDDKEEVIDLPEWLKKEFNVDSAEVLKQEREEYVKLKGEKDNYLKFDNEDSRRLYEAIKNPEKRKEVKEILDLQDTLDVVTSKEITAETAEDIIKLGMKLTKGLTKDEIEYKFKKEFGYPKEPVKGEFEEDSEFEEKHGEWKQRIADINMERAIEAKGYLPELQNKKSQLKLPEIPTSKEAYVPTQEELDAHKKSVDSFVQSVNDSFSSFTGFGTTVKDKDVDFAVNYDLSADEKTNVTAKLNQFANEGFDANALFAKRWASVDDKGNVSMNVQQMIKDLSLLEASEKVHQKIAIESANKRMEEFLKEKKNINLNVSQGNGETALTGLPANKQEVSKKLQEAAFA